MATLITGSGVDKVIDGSIVDADIVGVSSSKLTGALPAVDGSALTGVAPTKATIEALGIAASSITGALPAIDGASLTNIDASGRILQVVTTHAPANVNLSAGSGDTDIGLNVTISPSSGSTLLHFVTCAYHAQNNQGFAFYGEWYTDSTHTGRAFYVNQDQDGGNTNETTPAFRVMTDPGSWNGSTSITYKAMANQSGGYTRFNFYGVSQYTIIEIGA